MMDSEEEEDGNIVEASLSGEKISNKSLDTTIVEVEIHNKNDKRIVEKRKEREDENIDDDDFITVNRRKTKKIIRSESAELQNKMKVDLEKNCELNEMKYEVCITSTENLPKQMALARLLRSENIKNILRIKYKSFNKVLIQFQEKEDAIKLLQSKIILDMGWRSQFVNELSLSYGVVRGVDLDLNEKDILEILECTTEIVAVKRLRRMNLEGKWIESESVRVCFQGKNLPSYLYAYDCRLKVEPYVFPVTQCSGCWQFGHVTKYCPKKKRLCPKCGGGHENCDMNKILCLNCKGNHFVLDKTCPLFLKEKAIRYIMSMEQVTYRKALQLFLEKQRVSANTHNNSQSSSLITIIPNQLETYSNVLKKSSQNNRPDSNTLIVQEKYTSPSEQDITKKFSQGRKNKNNDKQRRGSESVIGENFESLPHQSEENGHQIDEQLLYKFEFRKFLIKLKNIFTSEERFEDKIVLFFKCLYEELRDYLSCYFSKGSLLQNIFNFING